MCVIHHVHLRIYLFIIIIIIIAIEGIQSLNEYLVVQFTHLIKKNYHPNQVNSVKTTREPELLATPTQTSQGNQEVGFTQCRLGCTKSASQ